MVAKKSVAKKSVTKKPAKKVARKKTAAKRTAPMKSFRVYKDSQSFTKFRITRQTVYWTILLVFIIITQLWILKVQIDISNLTANLAIAQ